MSSLYNPEEIDVVILCGGLGRRLKGIVPDRPKPMAKIGERPFLEILIDYLSGQGFTRFILCAGHMGWMIEEYFSKKSLPFELLFSFERELLGTAGAARNASSIIKTSPFFVFNGDSICKVDFKELVHFHKSRDAQCSIVLAKIKDTKDYGGVEIEKDGRIVGFNEKVSCEKEALVNAGIYLMRKEILELIPDGKASSFEYDIFPRLCRERFYGFITEGELLDIGTPARYIEAKERLRWME